MMISSGSSAMAPLARMRCSSSERVMRIAPPRAGAGCSRPECVVDALSFRGSQDTGERGRDCRSRIASSEWLTRNSAISALGFRRISFHSFSQAGVGPEIRARHRSRFRFAIPRRSGFRAIFRAIAECRARLRASSRWWSEYTVRAIRESRIAAVVFSTVAAFRAGRACFGTATTWFPRRTSATADGSGSTSPLPSPRDD